MNKLSIICIKDIVLMLCISGTSEEEESFASFFLFSVLDKYDNEIK